ncbi:hypothetical protein RKD18_003468 [Streptomyces phaeoluteigriseus]
MLSRLTRPQALAVCALPLVALFATVGLAPLPFSVAQPGMTANVLGENKGTPVITISGAPTRDTTGQLRMTTIEATSPDAHITLGEVIDGWFRTDQAVMPRDSVYPAGDSTKEIERHNTQQMEESQDTATEAALRYLDRADDGIEVTLELADVGGPSAGLLFSLGIVDRLDGDGQRRRSHGRPYHRRDRDHRRAGQGRRGRRCGPEDAGRPPGRRDRVPGAEGRVLGRQVRTARGPAADPGVHPRGRGQRPGRPGEGRRLRPELLRPWFTNPSPSR